MEREKHLPLTETVFYILLALIEPAHGYLIMQKIEELSGGQVRMAAGTLYGAIENLVNLGFIEPTASDDRRRKVYIITEQGKRILQLDVERMNHMMSAAEEQLKKDRRNLG
ncbi:PadR family transcriptional regulator [Paenibacillus piscarius]|uniref:PadR family transcriptional regulator n=1 Tax=Paenibacillus piscarius TaxID=1089681 RepID=UPI001EE81870|nr:PadR family transcriptional regulator [Paenibacillus piscarius]